MTETSALPPKADKRPVYRRHHGDKYADDYEWLRHADEKERLRLLNAENAWTRKRTRHLDSLVEDLTSEIVAHTKVEDTSVPYREGGWWYYARTTQGKQYETVYRVPDRGWRPRFEELTAECGEEMVWDGNALATGREFFSLSGFRPSPSGRFGALGFDDSGSEHFVLRIFDIERQVVIDDSMDGLGYGLAWTNDSKNVIVTKVDKTWRSWQVWLHPVGQKGNDHLIFQENDPRFEVSMSQSRDGRWIVIHSSSPTTTEVRLLDRANPYSEPILVCPRTPGLDYNVEPAGDHLLVVHNANAKDFEVAMAPLGDSGPDQWECVLAAEPGERIIWADAFRDFAVISMRSGGRTELRVMRRIESMRGDGGTHAAPVGGEGAGFEGMAGSDGAAGEALPVWTRPAPIVVPDYVTIDLGRQPEWVCSDFVFVIESVLLPARHCTFNPETNKVEVVKETLEGFDSGRYAATNATVLAEDGTDIPMMVFHRADVVPDGTNPGLLYGYGAYEIANDPYYKAALISLLDRGVVIGWTHVRGGGEKGREWYEEGRELAKKNTFTDFVACARHLRESGWVAPGRLAAEGRSAGGLLIGAAINLAPEEFCAVHAGMPFVDVLTTICNPSLPLTAGEWEEWGNPLESQEAYEYMKSYSPVENVRECEYPAILATTSLNDVRVSWVEPTKWVQVLREKTTNDPVERPILEKIEMVAGHAGASGRYDRWRSQAFEYAWILDRIGAA